MRCSPCSDNMWRVICQEVKEWNKPMAKWKPPFCAPCGKDAVLRSGAQVYPHRPDLRGISVWCCPTCDARTGARASGKPVGTLASADLRSARMQAHNAFDRLWRGPQALYTRTQAYAWMARELGLQPEAAHMGQMGESDCQRVIQAVAALRRATGGEDRVPPEGLTTTTPEDPQGDLWATGTKA